METNQSQARKTSNTWLDEIRRYSKKYEKFVNSGKSTVAIYRGEEKSAVGTKFNILRSNVATLKPALYARPPKPVVSRRFKDKNPAARMASTILERCLDYEITQYSDYNSALSNAVNDRLLPGRGVAWVRYEPTTEEQEAQITEDVEAGEGKGYDNEESNAIAGDEPLIMVTNEQTPCDYVYWKDFAHNANARTWEEVTWVARRVCVDETAGVDRFGDIFKMMPQAKGPEMDGDKEETATARRSNVWEIWHKPTKAVCWVCEGYEYLLDEKPDPLGLQDFFPCPKPLYSALTTDSLVPRSDFSLYQDQARELDKVTQKIDEITQALEVKGFFAAELTELKGFLTSGNNSKMYPITNWPVLAEMGGIKGAVDFLPLGPMIEALGQLAVQRETIIQTIYQLSGISDIQRGASDPNETASAQQIKAQFSSIRLGEMKQDVARFACDLLRMKAEVMAEKYQPETLVKMSGIMYMPEAQQNPQIVNEAIALLKNEEMRTFSIDIEDDTLVEMDERAEQQSRVEFLGAISPFLEKAVAVGQQVPDLVPVIGEMMLFGIRGFKVGQSMESTFENAFDGLEEKRKQAEMQPPQPPPPDPVQMKIQAEQQDRQMQMQIKMQEGQASSQLEQQKMQMEQANLQRQEQLKQIELQAYNEIEIRKLDFARWKVEREEQTKLIIAQLDKENKVKLAAMSANKQDGMEYGEDGEPKASSAAQQMVDTIAESHNSLLAAIAESNQAMVASLAREMARPKMLARDANGNKIAIPVPEPY